MSRSIFRIVGVLAGCAVACSPSPNRAARPVHPIATQSSSGDASAGETGTPPNVAVEPVKPDESPSVPPAPPEPPAPSVPYEYSCGPDAAPGFENVVTVRPACKFDPVATASDKVFGCILVTPLTEAEANNHADVECWFKTQINFGSKDNPSWKDVVTSSGFTLRIGADVISVPCVDSAHAGATVIARSRFAQPPAPSIALTSSLNIDKTSLHCRAVSKSQ